jgi:hypothetical protein
MYNTRSDAIEAGNEGRSSPDVIIKGAIIDMLAGVDQGWKAAPVMGVPGGITPEQTYKWLMSPENESKITERNDTLTKEHTDFIKKYNSMTNSDDRRKFRQIYENTIDNIADCRIVLLESAARFRPLERESLEDLINIPYVITKWLYEDIKDGGRRRKTNKVKKSKMRVFRRRSSKSKKSRKSRKYVR